jgi:hypothetical protein
MRGRWFARRNRRAHLSTAIGILVAGLLLSRLEPGSAFEAGAKSGTGFTVVFALAAACRAASAALLLASPEPRFGGLPGRVRVFRFLRTERGTSAWRLVLFVALLQLSVYVAAPFFQPYMLEELRFSYLELMAASIAVTAFKVTLLPLWGAGIDKQGARPVCTAAAILIAIVPLPWLWARGLGVVLFAECLSGIAWAGFEVAQFSLFLEATYRRTRLAVFAAQSLANGVAQLVGTLLGAGVIALVGDSRGVFAVSIAGRVIAALCILRFMPIPARLRTVEARRLLLRVIGFRPNGGVVHRPIDVDAPAPEREPERA